jgi:hypothetical protein
MTQSQDKSQGDRTHICMILDRTGSMESIKQDTIGGFNSYIAAQKSLPTPATFTLVQFDSQDPFNGANVYAAGQHSVVRRGGSWHK